MTMIANLTMKSIRTQLQALPNTTLSAICDLMAKDFRIKRPKFKTAGAAINWILETDDDDLGDFIRLVEKKGIYTFQGPSSLGELSAAINKIGQQNREAKAVTSLKDRKLVNAIHDDAKEALEAVAKKYGLLVTARSGSFNAFSFGFRVEFQVADGSGQGSSNGGVQDKKDWERLAHLFNLKPEWYGETFTHRGTEYKIVGIAGRSPKNVVRITRTKDNREMRCSASMIRLCIK